MSLPFPAVLVDRCREWIKVLGRLANNELFPIAIATVCPAVIVALTLHFGKTTSFPASAKRLSFQDNPERRGTLNIVYNCLTTIFASVFVALHLNLDQTNITAKISMVLAYTLIPEFMLYDALAEFAAAWRGVVIMRGASEGQWTMKHAFFRCMGGFQLENGGEFTYWWLKDGDHAERVDYKKLLDEIDDRSKKDVVAKTIACFQILMILVQTIARRIQSLDITQLELMTCGYIALALITYALWWNKPYDVHQTVVVRLKSADTRTGTMDSDSLAVTDTGATVDSVARRLIDSGLQSQNRRSFVIGMVTKVLAITRCIDSIMNVLENEHVQRAFGGLAGVAFGGIHCFAWNATFAITSGQLLWRICSCVLTVVPVVYCAAASSFAAEYIGEDTFNVLHFVLGVQYIIARGCLLLLVGYSFWSLPATAYEEVKWTTFIPQFN